MVKHLDPSMRLLYRMSDSWQEEREERRGSARVSRGIESETDREHIGAVGCRLTCNMYSMTYEIMSFNDVT